jgi:hypothetical protein
MYFLISEQPAELTLSEDDIEAFVTVCGEGSRWDTIEQKIRSLII